MALALIAAPASAEPNITILKVKPNQEQLASTKPCQRFCILPPVEFDHPYTGKLTVKTVLQREDLREFCGEAFHPWTLGCARRDETNDSCHIVIANNNMIREQDGRRS